MNDMTDLHDLTYGQGDMGEMEQHPMLMDDEHEERQHMTEDELMSYIHREETAALGYFNGSVAGERAKAIEYYFGEPFGNEVEGRSQVISTDVADAIEGLLPGLLKPFISSNEMVKFNPVGPNDEQAAEQETAYVNHVMRQRNNGVLVMYTWFKDALMQKNGIVKYYWEKKKVCEVENYKGLTDDQMKFIAQDVRAGAVEFLEINPYPDPMFAAQSEMMMRFDPVNYMQQAPQLYDIKIRRTQEKGLAKIANIPPEEILVSKETNTISLKDSQFVQHGRKMTISEIRNMGIKIADDISDYGDDLNLSPEYQARRNEEESEVFQATTSPENRRVMFKESYYRIDFDGDGIAELRKVCSVGSTVLSNEEAEEIQFCVICPYITPHKFFGESVADKTMDIQLKKSTLERNYLDNLYTMNNNRVAISNRVNLDDVLDEGIPGIVRIDSDQVGNDIMPLPITPIGPLIEPMLQRLDNEKMIRVGYTPMQPEMDANAINNTATGVRAQTASTQSRQELMARMFAETGVTDLMISIHGLLRRHAIDTESVKLRDQWVTIDPRSWIKRTDMTVSVGLGSGTQQENVQSLQVLIGLQAQAAQIAPGQLVKPLNAYNALVKLTESLGYKDYTQFWTDPSKQPPAPQQPNPDLIKAQNDQAKIQSDDKYNQAKAQLEMQNLQLKNKELEAEIAIKNAELELANKKLGIEEVNQAINTHMQIKNYQLTKENSQKENDQTND